MKQPGQQESTYTMPARMEMGVVSLTVADMGRSISFYERLLGCTVMSVGGNTAVLGNEKPLLILIEQHDASPRPLHSTGLYHVAFLLPSRADLACALHHLLKSGYPPSSLQDHGISEALYLSDPDGNGIELYRDRPRSAWPWQHDKLEASNPSIELSSESLLAELDGTVHTWQGLPPFTRVGHVHLQVADLRQSVVFYRDVLGLEESITGMNGASFFAAGGYHHHIACNIWMSQDAPPPPRNTVGLRYFTLVLPERTQVMRLVSCVYASGIEVTQHGHSYLIHDPANNGILLTAEALQQSQDGIALAGVFG